MNNQTNFTSSPAKHVAATTIWMTCRSGRDGLCQGCDDSRVCPAAGRSGGAKQFAGRREGTAMPEGVAESRRRRLHRSAC